MNIFVVVVVFIFFFFHLVRVLLNAHQRQPHNAAYIFFSSSLLLKNSVKSMEKHGPMWWTLRLFRKNINVCCTMCAILHKLEMISLCSRHAVCCCCFAVLHVAHVVETAAAAAAKLQIRIVFCTTLKLMSVSRLSFSVYRTHWHTHTFTHSHTQSLLMCCLIKRQKCYRKWIVQKNQIEH